MLIEATAYSYIQCNFIAGNIHCTVSNFAMTIIFIVRSDSKTNILIERAESAYIQNNAGIVLHSYRQSFVIHILRDSTTLNYAIEYNTDLFCLVSRLSKFCNGGYLCIIYKVTL